MEIKCLPYGMFGSNSYIISHNGESAVIDAGVGSGDILDAAGGNTIRYIILTHGHIDHICCVDELREKTGAKVLMGREDADALTDSMKNGSALFGVPKGFKPADGFLSDNDLVNIGGLNIKVITTPGHSPGCICLGIEDKCIFTGDTLFKLSIGRTDLEGGSYEEIIASIKTKLMALKDDIVVYPGHGEASTIGCEKKFNPFLKNR